MGSGITASNSDDAQTESRIQSFTLLLVEDNPGDARLFREALSDSLADSLYVVSTGEEALDFVNQRGEYEETPNPDFIFLDWHLPDMHGEDVLVELNDNPDYNHIPIIVLTGSQSVRETRRAYKQNANACLSKRASPDELEATLRAFENFWLSAARLPSYENSKPHSDE